MISCDLGTFLCRICGDKRSVDPRETRKIQSDKGTPDAKRWTQTESSLAEHIARGDWQTEAWKKAATDPEATPSTHSQHGVAPFVP